MNTSSDMLTFCILSVLFRAEQHTCEDEHVVILGGPGAGQLVYSHWRVRQTWNGHTQLGHCGRRPEPLWKLCVGPPYDAPLYQFYFLLFLKKKKNLFALLNARTTADLRQMQIAGESYSTVQDPSRPDRSRFLEVNEQFSFSTHSVKSCSGTGNKPLKHLSTVLHNNFHYHCLPLQARERRVQLWHRRFTGYMPTWKHPLMALKCCNRTDVRCGS